MKKNLLRILLLATLAVLIFSLPFLIVTGRKSKW